MAQTALNPERIVRAYLGLGANLGDPQASIRAACTAIGKFQHTRIARAASLYKTSPVGHVDQPDFINTVIAIDTGLSASDLARELKALEKALGRQSRPRWHEREIDIDVLTYNDDVLALDDLIVPHPRLQERRFVLVPFAEIAPAAIPTGLSRSVAELLNACVDPGVVHRVGALDDIL